ncbi:unnamed protein product, partial [Symbiodinium microadriaticum]
EPGGAASDGLQQSQVREAQGTDRPKCDQNSRFQEQLLLESSLREEPQQIWRGDRELVAEACWANGLALQHAPPELRNDWEVVMCAVSKSGTALMWASSELQADREVVLKAVEENGGALEYASQDSERYRIPSNPAQHIVDAGGYGFDVRIGGGEWDGDTVLIATGTGSTGVQLGYRSRAWVSSVEAGALEVSSAGAVGRECQAGTDHERRLLPAGSGQHGAEEGVAQASAILVDSIPCPQGSQIHKKTNYLDLLFLGLPEEGRIVLHHDPPREQQLKDLMAVSISYAIDVFEEAIPEDAEQLFSQEEADHTTLSYALESQLNERAQAVTDSPAYSEFVKQNWPTTPANAALFSFSFGLSAKP